MKRFEDKSKLGHEKAIRRGTRVPDGAVNIAWVKSPKLTPEKNVVMIDTSRIVQENASKSTYRRKIFYANSLGILEDEHGNQIIEDEYPAVADVFSIDEDWLTTPGVEYTAESILPFVHVSRFFHVDFVGLTLGTTLQTFNDESLKVIDEKGRNYVDDDGNPRYRIQITPAYSNIPSSEINGVYRVWAFVDEVTDQNLYLTYNKVELATTGLMKNQKLGHREIINAQPYYQYTPEESDVVDPVNRREKIYSTKPVTLKNQVLDIPFTDADGYKVYVPKKAIGDTRIFQLFRWRLACDFIERFKVDPITETRVINVGVIVTNNIPTSRAAYCFYNLQRSNWNAAGIRFINPLNSSSADQQTVNPTEQEFAAYWHVNFDTVSREDLKKFDVLVWAPHTPSFQFGPYLKKIKYYTQTHRGCLIIDAHNYMVPQGLGISTSGGFDPRTGEQYSPGPTGRVTGNTIVAHNEDNVLFNGLDTLGGWDFHDLAGRDEFDSITPFNNVRRAPGYVQGILDFPDDYDVLLRGDAGQQRAVLITKKTGNTGSSGAIYFGTAQIAAGCSYLWSHITGKKKVFNRDPRINRTQLYDEYINSSFVEGMFKFFYNVILLAVRRQILDSPEENAYSSSWTFATPWKASWVIDAGNDVLTDHEKDTNDFVFLPKDPTDPVPVWQRKLSRRTLKELLDRHLSDEDLRRIHNSRREYRIEVTNSAVEVPTTLTDKSIPYAWTEAFTPKFEVPVELGPHVIRDSQIQGDYQAGQYIHRDYPSKPYSVQAGTLSVKTHELLTIQKADFTAHGKATRTVITKVKPTTTDTTLSWAEHGHGTYTPAPGNFELGYPAPQYVETWQNHNYHTNAWGPGNLNWPFYGITSKLSLGSHGELVSFVQAALNKFAYYGTYNSGIGYLAVDGYYGPRTTTAVRAFQFTRSARYVDGVVDAETWFLIGAQIMRLGPFLLGTINPNDHTRFFNWPAGRMARQHISDNNPHSAYAKRSWVSGGPPIIWEMFKINFVERFNIHGVTVIPYLEGNTRTLMVRSVHIVNSDISFTNYDSRWGQLIWMPHRPVDGQPLYIPIGPYYGNTVIVGVGQDGPSGWGSARMLGVRDILAHARTTTGGGGTKKVDTVDISYSGRVSLKAGTRKVIQAKPEYDGEGELSNIRWHNLTLTNPNIFARMTTQGQITLENNLTNQESDDDYVYGPKLPGNGSITYFSMNENKVRNPGRETGWISKTEGVKLLCDELERPIGIPVMPTTIGRQERQRHYTMLNISLTGNDPSVLVGFYDVSKKEFLLNDAGEPELSYIEYIRRGPQNIYIGLISTYELETKTELPVSDDAPPVPFRWAMPVYGVAVRSGSQISLEPLPKDLGPQDVWAVPIRTGKFNRSVGIANRITSPLTNWVKEYQGTTLRAFYNIPEASLGGWSKIYGRPYSDVQGEHPTLVDDNIMRISQPPIALIQEPTSIVGLADPVRPVFKVFKRSTPTSAWVEVLWSEIEDYNVFTGEIQLKTALESADNNLIKVDYTTSRQIYYFKQHGNHLNLNPYPGHNRDLIGKPIYIYIIPEYVKEDNGRVIPASVQTRALRFALEPNVFDPISPDYDPLAIQLGVIYITTALDISDLVMLDSRRRGGGVKDSINAVEIKRMVSESSTYWDMSYGAGLSYQRGGFVIIRLPEELKVQFPEQQDILDIIERNITAGVRFKVENLQGQAWS